MGKATTAKDGKFVAPPGTAEAFQKYLELEAGRSVGPACERHAGQHWSFGGNHVRQAEGGPGDEEEAVTNAHSNIRAACVPPFFLPR